MGRGGFSDGKAGWLSIRLSGWKISVCTPEKGVGLRNERGSIRPIQANIWYVLTEENDNEKWRGNRCARVFLFRLLCVVRLLAAAAAAAVLSGLNCTQIQPLSGIDTQATSAGVRPLVAGRQAGPVCCLRISIGHDRIGTLYYCCPRFVLVFCGRESRCVMCSCVPLANTLRRTVFKPNPHARAGSPHPSFTLPLAPRPVGCETVSSEIF